MADATYTPKVYKKQGGDQLVVASGGSILVESGGAILPSGGAVPNLTALTDNGGGTADGTIAALTAATTLTDNTGGSGTHDDTLAAVTTFTPSVAWNGSSVYPSAADATAIAAAITTLNQNASDTAQKVIELVAWQATVQNNVKELTTKVNELIAALIDAGLAS